jgi:AcrR family transcriptional regulator
MNKLDPRVRRSRLMLRNAFVEQLKEKEYNTISVIDITKCADLNRATFYMHYKDKEDLLQQSIDEVLSEMTEHLQRIELNTMKDILKLELLYLNMFELIAKNSNFYKAMMCNGDIRFTNQLQELFRSKISYRLKSQHHLKESEDAMEAELLIAYLSYAHIGVIKWWLENDLKYSPSYLAKTFSRMVTFS